MQLLLSIKYNKLQDNITSMDFLFFNINNKDTEANNTEYDYKYNLNIKQI